MSDEWKDRGACRDEDPELFFPVGWGPDTEPQILQAKLVCFGCDVASQCLRWAMDNAEDGIWGGTTEPERRRIRGRLAAATIPRDAEKWCSGCEADHPLTAFAPNKRAPDGRKSQCRKHENRRKVARRRERMQQAVDA